MPVIRSKRRITRRKARGGAKLGEGQYGIAFRPPLRCEGDAHAELINERYVGKVLPASAAEHEVANGLQIALLDPSGVWSAPCTVACTPAAGEGSANIAAFVAARSTNRAYQQPMRQIIAPYAGRSLFQLLVREGASFNESMFNQVGRFGDLIPEQLDTFVRLIKDFLPTVNTLNKTMLHGDLHPGNIAWDGERLRMIDFGEMRSVQSMLEFRKNHWSDLFDGYDGIPDDLKEDLLTEIMRNVILDEARSMDMNTLFSGILAVIGSRWVNQTFPGRYNQWLASVEESPPTMYNDFVVYIMRLP